MAPVLFINEAVAAEPVGERAIISLDSIGAEVRLSLSRQQLAKLEFLVRRAGEEMDSRPGCLVIPFPGKGRMRKRQTK